MRSIRALSITLACNGPEPLKTPHKKGTCHHRETQMTTFQALVFAILPGFTAFLPVSSNAHHILIPSLLHGQEPSGALWGARSLGAWLSVFVDLLYDWASLMPGLLQLLIDRNKPLTWDERLPHFSRHELPSAAPTRVPEGCSRPERVHPSLTGRATPPRAGAAGGWRPVARGAQGVEHA
jgi:hypothetical protein